MAELPHVVIVGGGFAGLEAAKQLADRAVRVTVIDRSNHHLFQPLLYQVATAGLSPGDIATPLRQLIGRHNNITVHMGDVLGVDLKQRDVKLRDSTIHYDRLILAAGVRHSYFGHPEWEQFAPGLKTLDDALEMRRRMLSAFEAAELETDAEKQRALLTFVVVGAGPTGVELAGAIAEFARFTVHDQYRNFDPRSTRVVLIEAGPRLLSAFDPSLSAKAQRGLEDLHVEVKLSTRVTDVNATGVSLGSTLISARTIFWAAGVAAPEWSRALGVPVDNAGRIKVNTSLQIDGFADAFVVGDLAACVDANGLAVPGLAPAAMQQGRYVADFILEAQGGVTLKPFAYFDKGIMATVGRSAGLAQVGKLKLSGFLGWLGWLFIHLVLLVGFENRMLVLTQWIWAWLTYNRSARLLSKLNRADPSAVQ